MSGTRRCTVCGKGWIWAKEGCRTCKNRTTDLVATQIPETGQSSGSVALTPVSVQSGDSSPPTALPMATNTTQVNLTTSTANVNAGPSGNTAIGFGATNPLALNPRRGSVSLDDSADTPTNTTAQATPTVTPTQTPVQTTTGGASSNAGAMPVNNSASGSTPDDGRARRLANNQRLKQGVDQIVGAPDVERRQRATDTANHIMGLRPDELDARAPAENVLAMAALTSVNERIMIDSTTYREETPAPQMAALAKLYENMKLDPDFEAQDQQQRNAILDSIANDSSAQNLSSVDWTPGFRGESAADSGSRLRHLQGLQTAHLPTGMLGTDDRLQLVAELDGGQSGVCRGKKVVISSDTDVNHSFDETLNTVVHETTHAYQKHLTDTIDTIPLDDPRYLQTQLFKFNNKGYADPPDKPGTGATPQQQEQYERLYKAYKNQPVERHAWQAGNEAGRLFDARAGAVAAVQTSQRVAQCAPNSGQEAAALAEQIRTGNSQQKSAAMLELDVLAEQAVGLASGTISQKQQDANCVTYIGASAWNGFERRRVAVLNDRRSKPAEKLATLETVMHELNAAFENGRAVEAIKTQVGTASTEITRQLNAQNVLDWLGATRWNAVEAQRHRLANGTWDAADRLRQIQELRDSLGPEIEQARIGKEGDAADKALTDVMRPNDTVALLGGADQWNELSRQRVNLFNDRSDMTRRRDQLVALKDQVTNTLTQARAAERAAETEFTRLWQVLTAEALPTPVRAVAMRVQNLRPRTTAVATLKTDPATLGYFQQKNVAL